MCNQSKDKITEELQHFTNKSSYIQLSLIEEYRIVLEKERCIAKVLGKMKLRQNDVIEGQIFVPNKFSNFLKNHIRELNLTQGTNVVINFDDFKSRGYVPPTYIENNDYTLPF